MSTRAIRTTDIDAACDVCGRTLLRGERAEIYLSGGARRSVCELCTSRALREGWVREGTVPAFDNGGARSERRRSLLGRLRRRRDAPGGGEAAPSTGEFSEQWSEPTVPNSRVRDRDRVREPRHVHAVPASVEHKISYAVDLFNESEHRRTVSGVARSLGLPDVAVLPTAARPSTVNVVISWELCWYRYEVDLSDDEPSVRVAAQGYELDELSPQERVANAIADERGELALP